MSTERAIVETNWILDVALERDVDSLRLWQLFKEGAVELFLPAFCVTEAVKALESMQGHWHQMAKKLRGHAGDIQRSASLNAHVDRLEKAAQALDELEDRAEELLWNTLQDIAKSTRSVSLTAEAIGLVADIRAHLDHSPADSAVLATAVVTNRAEGEKIAFMSRDNAFKSRFGSASALT
jgi:predicted nucleic acid-binding protein